jgi:glycosyltransferase involved in cell wall biosynthesis
MKQIELSIITPVYNGSKFISAYFEALENLEIPENIKLSIIIVDNGSTDDSVVLIKKFLEEDRLEYLNGKILSYIDISSSYSARNFGVSHSNSDYYIFTDIDCIIHCDYINKLNELIISQSYDIIAGDVKLFTQKKPNIYEIYDLLFGFNLKVYKLEDTSITANLVVSNACITNMGGFDSYISGADRNFCRKAKQEGFNFFFADNIIVDHPARDSFTDHYIKTIRVANGKAKYVRNKGIGFRVKVFIKNFISCIFQLHQIKTLYLQKHIYSRLTIYDKIKLFLLSFYLGALGRLQINYKISKT